MKVAYVDCFSGASGDMLLGAIVDAGLPAARLRKALSALPIRGWRLTTREVVKVGVRSVKADVLVAHGAEGHGHGRTVGEILSILRRSRLPERIKERARRVFLNLAEAEGRVHRKPPMEVHFHEVGAVDAIIDIVGACLGFDLLGIERLFVSRLPITHGEVRGAHGVFPVPGPATLELLKGRPVTSIDIAKELVTPTGAAILTTLAEEMGTFPAMTIRRIGYGAGDYDLEGRPNVLRLLVGETEGPERSDTVAVVETNLDNVSGEVIGYLYDRLLAAGALDVYTTPIQMKKSRPAVKLTLLASPDRVEELQNILFTETPTLGIRRYLTERTTLERETARVRTPYGAIRVKIGRGAGTEKAAPEHDDCRRAAERHGVPLSNVTTAALTAYRRKRNPSRRSRNQGSA